MRLRAGDFDSDKARVFMDGVEVRDCFVADDEEGYADVYARDSAGSFFKDGDRAATKRLRGRVDILVPFADYALARDLRGKE